jgi:aspartyl-tRNA(Asn)/glutamyl-tRNA(Gln) amidotransferase subunit C
VLSTACRAAPPPRRSRAAPRRSAMPISRADVQHVARLARLALTDEELDRFQSQLSVILEEAEKVKRLPTEGVPPTSHPLPRVNVWRDDVAGPCLTRDEALSTAPAVEQDRFLVPRIIEEEA